MKEFIITIFFVFVWALAFPQTNAFSQLLQTKSRGQVSLSSFSHKKILIVVCSAFNPDVSRLHALDNLAKANLATLQVVVVPLIDIDSPAIKSGTPSLVLDTMKSNFIICIAGNGKKSASGSQVPLLGWLTKKTGNIHFDNDMQNSSQMFVIGENGILYAELFGANDLTNGNLTGVLNARSPDN